MDNGKTINKEQFSIVEVIDGIEYVPLSEVDQLIQSINTCQSSVIAARKSLEEVKQLIVDSLKQNN